MNEMDKVDVLVATPLRLKGLIEKKRVSLSAVRYLVLDCGLQAVRGWIRLLFAAGGGGVRRAREHPLFSATLPEVVERLARSVMTAPTRLTVGERNAASETVAQSLVFCGQERLRKPLALRQLFAEGREAPAIVFTQSKDRAKQLARELQGDGLRLGLIHIMMSDAAPGAGGPLPRGGHAGRTSRPDLMARGMDFVAITESARL